MKEYSGEIQILTEQYCGYKHKVESINEADEIFEEYCKHNNLIRDGFKASKIGEIGYYLIVYASNGRLLDDVIKENNDGE